MEVSGGKQLPPSHLRRYKTYVLLLRSPRRDSILRICSRPTESTAVAVADIAVAVVIGDAVTSSATSEVGNSPSTVPMQGQASQPNSRAYRLQ